MYLLNFSLGHFSAPLTWQMGCGPPSFYILLNVSLLAPVLPLFYGNSPSIAPAASALLVLLSFLPVHSPLFEAV